MRKCRCCVAMIIDAQEPTVAALSCVCVCVCVKHFHLFGERASDGLYTMYSYYTHTYVQMHINN